MSKLSYQVRDPNKAYVTNNLLLPRRHIHDISIKSALSFICGEEEVVDEDGSLIGTRARTIDMWDETPTHLIVPREFISPLTYPDFKFDFVIDKPLTYPAVEIHDRIELREPQLPAYEALLKNDCGTLNLSCGKGKTVLALKLTSALQVPTVVVVNTTALLEQWKLEIEKHLNVASVGVIQGQTRDWNHPISVAMVHTLSSYRYRWPKEFVRRVGLVLYDEGHHMSAPVFARSADLFSGKRFSLTATANRTDGLEAIYQYHLGSVIYRDLSQTLIPLTSFRRLKWELPEGDKIHIEDSSHEVCMPRVRTYLGQLDWRNCLILSDIRKAVEAGRQALVLSHSVKHVERLSRAFSNSGGGHITGGTPQGSRMAILRGCNPVAGTFQLAREGLDKPSLDTLFITTPFANSNDLQQSWGRIQREYEGKQKPEVVVYEDLAIEACVKACRRLRSFLKKLGYPINQKIINAEELKREFEIPF